MLRQMFKELIAGENVDLYIPILVSIVAIIFSIFSLFPSSIIMACILAILLALSMAILRERWLRNEFREEMKKLIKLEDIWENITNQFRRRLKIATKVKFITISPWRVINDFGRELKQILEKKAGEIMFIIVDPDSDAMKLIVRGQPDNDNHGRLFIQKVHEDFGDYIKKGQVTIKKINYIPSHIVTIVDEGRWDETIFYTIYSYKQDSSARPSEIITRRNAGLKFSYFLNEFDFLWNEKNWSNKK